MQTRARAESNTHLFMQLSQTVTTHSRNTHALSACRGPFCEGSWQHYCSTRGPSLRGLLYSYLPQQQKQTRGGELGCATLEKKESL